MSLRRPYRWGANTLVRRIRSASQELRSKVDLPWTRGPASRLTAPRRRREPRRQLDQSFVFIEMDADKQPRGWKARRVQARQGRTNQKVRLTQASELLLGCMLRRSKELREA